MLFLIIVSCSIIGPLKIGLPAKDTYIKAIWRIQGWAIANFIIIAIMYLISPSSYYIKKAFSWSSLKSTAILGFLLITWATRYILGWSLTITSHVDIMYSSSWVWIYIWVQYSLEELLIGLKYMDISFISSELYSCFLTNLHKRHGLMVSHIKEISLLSLEHDHEQYSLT